MNQNVLKALEPLKISLQVAKIGDSSFVYIGDYIKDMNELKEVIKDLYERIEVLEKQSEDFITNTQMSWKNHKWNT